jgi:hypothetical protein
MTTDPNNQVRELMERFFADLVRLGMERPNAAKLMVIQGAIRLEALADLEEMQQWTNREVADWQEATDDDADEAAQADACRLQ